MGGGRHSSRKRAVHRDENDEELCSSALKAHTLAQRDQRLVNPQGGDHHSGVDAEAGNSHGRIWIDMDEIGDDAAHCCPALWILGQVRNDGPGLWSPSDPSVKHWDRP